MCKLKKYYKYIILLKLLKSHNFNNNKIHLKSSTLEHVLAHHQDYNDKSQRLATFTLDRLIQTIK